MRKIRTSCIIKIALLIVGITAQDIATNAQISTPGFKDRITPQKMVLTK